MDPGPKVLHCGPSRAAVSGVATHLNQLFDSSLAEKYELVQFQVGSEGRDEGRLSKLLRYLFSPLQFVVALLRLRPAIVHLNTSMEARSYWRDLTYLLAAKSFFRKVVYQVHGGGLPSTFLGRSRLSHAFLRWTLRRADAIVLLAQVELDEYRRFRAGQTLAVVPNAIRLEEYADFQPKRFDRERLVLGYIGRLADDKGVKETIDAIEILSHDGPVSFEFRVAGSGPFERRLREQVAAKGLEAAVTFQGPIFGEDKLSYWRDIDIFVFPTFHREGLPYTTLEALASGTPTLTTWVGGIPDVIRDGIEGMLLTSHDPSVVAEAISKLVSDRGGLRKMSISAMQRARENYGVERLAAQFDRIYRELLT